ncbi:MAG: hypothetical protein J0I04_13360 [Paenarthrobacter ureafaciens]|nr:hypothetical protein [Paenarthrobacter ureafaciens]
MMGMLRSELLRFFSGYSFLGVLGFSILIPWFVSNFLGWPSTAGGLTVVENARIFWALAATMAIVSVFAGSYVVSREAHYGTLKRSVVMCGLTRLVLIKYAAAVAVALIVALAGTGLWAASLMLWSTPEARAGVLVPDAWRFLPGVLLASVLGGVWGCSLGWIIRHYYATTVAAMLVPLAVELPLLANSSEVARWLPSGALAGISSVPFEGLLPPIQASLVFLAWIALSGIGAVLVLGRKEL